MAIPHIQNLKKDPHHKDKKGPSQENLELKTYALKTLFYLAAAEEDKEEEQVDMAYVVGSFSLL